MNFLSLLLTRVIEKKSQQELSVTAIGKEEKKGG